MRAPEFNPIRATGLSCKRIDTGSAKGGGVCCDALLNYGAATIYSRIAGSHTSGVISAITVTLSGIVDVIGRIGTTFEVCT